MKKLLALIAITSFLLSSCTEDDCTNTYTYLSFTPVYKSVAEINEDIRFESQRILENPGKIYFYNNLILINEREQGVHVIDNTDPRKPLKKGFLAIPGNIDISMTSHYIYADMQFNVVVIDIENLESPKVVNIITQIKGDYWPENDEGKFVTSLIETEQIETFSCEEYPGVYFNRGGVWFLDSAAPLANSNGSIPDFNQNGQAGSFARMALFDGYFYYVSDYIMHVFDASRPESPDKLSEVYMQWGVETIFPYKDNLFVGANNGMHIYGNKDKTNPTYISTFEHARACDPVVVEGETAYVTLRNGTECEGFANQLDVIDITSLSRPQLIASFPMHNPHGLSVRNSTLYLCEGDQGLKVFDVSNPEEVDRHFLGSVKDLNAYDVISVTDRLLLMVGDDGFYQFDTQDQSQLKLLSVIKKGE